MVAPIVCGVLCLVLVFLIRTLCPSSVAIALMGKRGLVVLLYLSSWCLVTVSVLRHFFTVPWVGLRCVMGVFSDHTHFFQTTDMTLKSNIKFK